MVGGGIHPIGQNRVKLTKFRVYKNKDKQWQLQTYTLTHLHTYILINLISLYTYTLIHLYMFTLIHLYTYTPIHLYTYTLIHLYTHTLIHLGEASKKKEVNLGLWPKLFWPPPSEFGPSYRLSLVFLPSKAQIRGVTLRKWLVVLTFLITK